MLTDLLKWGGKRPDSSGRGTDATAPRDEPVVASKAFPKFVATLSQKDAPVLLDLGPVIGSNVGFCGERLGCKLFIEDLLVDIERHTKAGTLDQLPAVFDKRFRHGDASVDGILCWDVFDFLDRAAALSLAATLARLLVADGSLLGFFSTAVEPGRALYTKYVVVERGSLRYRTYGGTQARQRSLQNRDIIKLFETLRVSDSFLMKTNMREIIFRKPAYLAGL